VKNSPTLADAAIRESLRNHSRGVPSRIGQKIAAARKFVLDTEASRFLSDLSHASYVDGEAIALTAVEKTRQLARLPHAITWIEYDPRAFKARTVEAYSGKVNYITPERDTVTGNLMIRRDIEGPRIPPENIVPNIGWLMEQCGETFVVTILVGDGEGSVLTLPCAFAWTSDDSVPNLKKSTPKENPPDSYLATGIHGYDSPHVVIGTVPEMKWISPDTATKALTEWMSELRFIWALLAAVNDIPVGIKHVTPSKGYVARGRYRKFVEHSVISILIPKQRDPQVFAREIVAVSRRRAHMVRGHWRRNWRSPDGKIWVNEHQRGDASLGFVLHDYSVEHKQEPAP
jgi:hypothetical protein